LPTINVGGSINGSKDGDVRLVCCESKNK